ncbi:MAG: hypothetical protein ACREVG_05050, partial [Burkholderiales bacterium]
MRLKKECEGNVGELVRDIERQTERLSPLLLCCEKALRLLLAGKKECLSVSEFANVATSLGISRPVLINRLNLIPHTGS